MTKQKLNVWLPLLMAVVMVVGVEKLEAQTLAMPLTRRAYCKLPRHIQVIDNAKCNTSIFSRGVSAANNGLSLTRALGFTSGFARGTSAAAVLVFHLTQDRQT